MPPSPAASHSVAPRLFHTGSSGSNSFSGTHFTSPKYDFAYLVRSSSSFFLYDLSGSCKASIACHHQILSRPHLAAAFSLNPSHIFLTFCKCSRIVTHYGFLSFSCFFGHFPSNLINQQLDSDCPGLFLPVPSSLVWSRLHLSSLRCRGFRRCRCWSTPDPHGKSP